jgi:hypothetical protein
MHGYAVLLVNMQLYCSLFFKCIILYLICYYFVHFIQNQGTSAVVIFFFLLEFHLMTFDSTNSHKILFFIIFPTCIKL